MTKRLFIRLGLLSVAFAASIYFLVPLLSLTKENIISVSGFYVVLIGAIIAYSQLRINFNYNKRKAAIDFCFNAIAKELQPLELQLKSLLGKQFFVFTPDEKLTDVLAQKEVKESKRKKVRSIVVQILNFYERMSIAIFKNTYDEDICYDDKGFLLVSFYRWSREHIENLRTQVNDKRIYINFEALAQRWEERYEKSAHKLSKHHVKGVKRALVENPQID